MIGIPRILTKDLDQACRIINTFPGQVIAGIDIKDNSFLEKYDQIKDEALELLTGAWQESDSKI